ncbi:bcl-2-like protein 11 isoform X3 [Scyliorhinus canicula]|uniref:bcl-2-like protein 11 isoform X3 n=1 Tax=Scyliorhinus canicula TaxID=7830 RepID=UPI0018F74536|nr:bcl-2-like protein 11 isoform X3 [Scyliorhinus canicula]
MSIVAGEKCNDFVFHRSEGGSDGTKQHPYSRLNITHMSRGELSDQGDSPTSTRCESIQVSPSFVTTCPLFNINFLRGLHSSVAPSSRSSRLSSGCYSLDTDGGQMTKPTSCDKATQTPSPTCQAIYHAQNALAQAQHLQIRERIQPSIGIQESSPSVPMDVRPEIWIGQELRRIGDDFNSHFQTGRARNHRPPNNQNGIFWHWINVLYRRRINNV